ACLEQALFSLPIHHWCCHFAPTFLLCCSSITATLL
ncbi:unnamed protein product, partial [Musa acuminata subsp. burmannicoides]